VSIAEHDLAEARDQFLGFMIPLMRAVGRMRRAIEDVRSAKRAAGVRADGQLGAERLLAAFNVRFEQIGDLFGHHALQEAARAACEGAGRAPYSRQDVPYPFGAQLSDWVRGTFSARARDFESRGL
jgi:hypothetical protein